MTNNFIPGAPALPYGAPAFGVPVAPAPAVEQAVAHTPAVSEKRAISYAADHGGCGFWRMHWPETVINSHALGVVTNSTFMLTDPRYYQGIKSVRIQRQVTPPQLEFVKFLRQQANANNFKIYYEIDDVIFPEDIPLYNKAREAFVDPIIKQTALQIIKLCDYVTSPTKYMGDYYTERTMVPNIVLPNYMPKFWIDRFYSKAKIVENFDKNKRRPRIGYVGSPTHINVARLPGVQDDLDPIIPLVRKTYKDFKWVFMGGLPFPLVDLYRSGDIEHVNWSPLYQYAYTVDSLNLNIAIAPLQNNKFNLAKAPIKYLEAGALGIPCICQDLEPYKIAPLRFDTPEKLHDTIKSLVSNRQLYLNESDRARKVATQYWLEDHIQEHANIYFPS